METENPSFTFATGAAILTPYGPDGYNWLDQSYAPNPGKAYQSHSHIDSTLVWVLC